MSTDPTPTAPKCGYCDQPATTSNGNCTEHYGRPPAGEWVEPDARKRVEAWRVGSKVPINVYEGDRPVCQCHNTSDPKRIVAAVNEVSAITAERDALRAELNFSEGKLGLLNDFYSARRDGETVEETLADATSRMVDAASQLAALRLQARKLETESNCDKLQRERETKRLWQGRAEAAESQLAALRQQNKKLRTYVRHNKNCAVLHQAGTSGKAPNCDCGLAAALKEVEEGK